MPGSNHRKPWFYGLSLLATFATGSVQLALARSLPVGDKPAIPPALSTLSGAAPEVSALSLKLGASAGILLCATLLAAALWQYFGAQRYRFALGYFACIALLLGVAIAAPGTSGWLLSPERILLLLPSLASVAGVALCLALLYPYQPPRPVRRSLQLVMGINGVVPVATATVSPGSAAMICIASAIGTSLVAAIGSIACTRQKRAGVLCESRAGHARPLILFGCSWLALACGLLLSMPADTAQVFSSTRQVNTLLLGLDLQLLLMSLALLDQAWLEYQEHLLFHRQSSEQARNSSSLLRARHQSLLQHNQELCELLRQGGRLDPATGLLSARALHHELDREHKISVRYGNHLSVIVIQIDECHMEDAQEAAGAGLAAIAALSRIVNTSLQRPGDIGGRITSNRIAVVLPYTGTIGAAHVAERIRQRAEDIDKDQAPQTSELRFGLASTETQLARHADDLLESAMGQVSEQLGQPG